MSNLNKNEIIKKMAAKRNAEQAERAKNRMANSFKTNAMLFIGEGVRFNDNDKEQINGTIYGHQIDRKTGGKKYIEVYIDPKNVENNLKKKKGEVSGGVIDAKLEYNWFPHDVLSRDKKTKTTNPSKLLDSKTNTYFTKNVEEIIKDLYPENVGKQQLMIVADGPTRVGTRKSEIDGETVDVVSYKVNWLTFLAVGSQLTNNIYENAVFSFKPNTYTHNIDGKFKKIAEIVDQVLVWQTDENNILKAVPFSDEEGIKRIADSLEEQMELQNYCLSTPDEPKYANLFEHAKRGGAFSYVPTISFGITVPMNDEEAQNSKSTKQHSQKMILLPLQQIQKTQRIKFEIDEETGKLVRDENGGLVPCYLFDGDELIGYEYETMSIEQEDGSIEEQEVWSTITPYDLELLMESFRLKVQDENDPIHKDLKEAYPDLDIAALTEDNYMIFFAKAFNYMIDRKNLMEVIEEFKTIADNENLSEKQKENAWNDLVFQKNTAGSSTDRALLQKVAFYNWNDEFSEETINTMSAAVKAATTTYAVTRSLKIGRKGVFHALRGIVSGGSLNENKDTLYFYPSARDVKPFSWAGRNLMAMYHAADFNPEDENAGGLFLELDMLKQIHINTDDQKSEEPQSDEETEKRSKTQDDKKAKQAVEESMNNLTKKLDMEDDEDEGVDANEDVASKRSNPDANSDNDIPF